MHCNYYIYPRVLKNALFKYFKADLKKYHFVHQINLNSF